ncbi:hypothetical protein C8R44DRAFT_565534, partial [Mycena epipterygia]
NDPAVIVRSIATQMKMLISEPCHTHSFLESVTLLIDGLDECEGHDIQQEILHAILDASNHSISLRFIVASRPEPHIREMFNCSVFAYNYCSLNVEKSFEDVRRYLRDEFSRIHRGHYLTMANIPSPWPTPKVLEDLVWKSSGHLIYAATMIKFID